MIRFNYDAESAQLRNLLTQGTRGECCWYCWAAHKEEERKKELIHCMKWVSPDDVITDLMLYSDSKDPQLEIENLTTWLQINE